MTGYDILLYPGQSNELPNGIGPFTDSSDANDSRIFQIGRLGSDNMQVVPATSILQFWEVDPSVWVPTARSFTWTLARLWAANCLEADRNILIVPAAHGGSSILEWLQIVNQGYDLYADMAARIAVALDQDGDNRIIGWFEQQGEQDLAEAMSAQHQWHDLCPDAATYNTLKMELIDKVRGDFGTFPMLFGLMTDAWLAGDPTKMAFEQAICDAAAARSMCAAVKTAGLTSDPDTVTISGAASQAHFSADAHEKLALRYFTSYCALLAGVQNPFAAFSYTNWPQILAFDILSL